MQNIFEKIGSSSINYFDGKYTRNGANLDLMNRTWHPIAISTLSILFFYLVFFLNVGDTKIVLFGSFLVLMGGFAFLGFRIIRSFQMGSPAWGSLQIVGLMLNGCLMIPAIFVFLIVLPNLFMSKSVQADPNFGKVESELRSACAEEAMLHCSDKSQDFEALVICLNNVPAYKINGGCRNAFTKEIQFPPLQQPRQIGKALLPQGSKITRSMGRISIVDSPDVLTFGEASCRAGIIHWAYAKSDVAVDDSRSYVMSCFLNGDQYIHGALFKDGKKPFISLFGPAATFFHPSGRVERGVLWGDQVINGTLVKTNGGFTIFDENGQVIEN